MSDDAFVCTASSLAAEEPLAGTASRVDVWLILEHHGRWEAKALEGWPEAESVKAPLVSFLGARPNRRFQFVRSGEAQAMRRVIVVDSVHGTAREIRVASYADISRTMLDSLLDGGGGDPVRTPLYLVCTHGKRDRCCARYGPPVYRAMSDRAPGRVLQTSHLGGHRFAPTVVVLPEGLTYGRITPAETEAIIRAHDAGRLTALPRCRGRSTLSPPAQAAEILLRDELNLFGIADLVLTETAGDGTRHRITFDTPDGTRIVVIDERTGTTPVQGSCAKKDKLKLPVFFERA